jgi:hypothetical protein
MEPTLMGTISVDAEVAELCLPKDRRIRVKTAEDVVSIVPKTLKEER